MADYITLPDVKAELGDLGTDYDSVLSSKITRASRAIDDLTERPWGFSLSVGAVKLFDGRGTKTLMVPDLNACTLVEVKVGGTWQTTYTAVPSTDIFLQPTDRPAGWPAAWIELTDFPHSQVVRFDTGHETVRVTGDYGWPSVPASIQEVCLEMVVRSFKARGSGHDDPTGADNLEVATMPRGLSRYSRDILARYHYYGSILN